MILGFKTINPFTGHPTGFVEKILVGNKIHSIREGNRWKKGDFIHMATGVRSKNYNQFNANQPYLQICTGTQRIIIVITQKKALNIPYDDIIVLIDGKKLPTRWLIMLVKNDGFNNLTDFILWFKHSKGFVYQIVHWTKFRY